MEITYNEGRIEGYVRLIVSKMKVKGISLEDAMDDLGIPEDDRQSCVEYIVRQNEPVTA